MGRGYKPIYIQCSYCNGCFCHSVTVRRGGLWWGRCRVVLVGAIVLLRWYEIQLVLASSVIIASCGEWHVGGGRKGWWSSLILPASWHKSHVVLSEYGLGGSGGFAKLVTIMYFMSFSVAGSTSSVYVVYGSLTPLKSCLAVVTCSAAIFASILWGRHCDSC